MLNRVLLSEEKGLSLVELMMAMMISLIILAVAYNLFFVGNRLQGEVAAEFELQSNMRYAEEILNNTIRNASVAFAISGDDFDENDLSEGWSYIGLSGDRQEILQYTWQNNTHVETTIVPRQDNLYYELHFEQQKEYENEKMIQFSLIALNSNDHDRMGIGTELEALSAIHVVNREMYFPTRAVALAYRTDPTPVAKKAHTLITVVLDTSGSMGWDLEGRVEVKETSGTQITGYHVGALVPLYPAGWHSYRNGNWYYASWSDYPRVKVDWIHPNRISILIDETKKLVTSLADKNIEAHINIIDFNTRGTMGTWRYIQNGSDKQALLNYVDGLIADGGTNTGDGLRQAYYAFTDFYNDTNLYTPGIQEKGIAHYLIVLVDGVTTYYSGTSSAFFSASGTAPTVSGPGNVLDARSEEYVRAIGTLIKNNGAGPSNKPIIPFVIGFSNKWESGKYVELESVNNIGDSIWDATEEGEPYSNHQLDIYQQGSPAGATPTRIFWAGDRTQLENIYNIIAERVLFDFWQVSGP